jgi:hypothetical protein
MRRFYGCDYDAAAKRFSTSPVMRQMRQSGITVAPMRW